MQIPSQTEMMFDSEYLAGLLLTLLNGMKIHPLHPVLFFAIVVI